MSSSCIHSKVFGLSGYGDLDPEPGKTMAHRPGEAQVRADEDGFFVGDGEVFAASRLDEAHGGIYREPGDCAAFPGHCCLDDIVHMHAGCDPLDESGLWLLTLRLWLSLCVCTVGLVCGGGWLHGFGRGIIFDTHLGCNNPNDFVQSARIHFIESVAP